MPKGSSRTQGTVSVGGARKSSGSICCGICDKNVLDDPRGEESIFCEGSCQVWVHRRCIGLSFTSFEAAPSSPDPFLCPTCHNHKLSNVITALESTISSLQDNVLLLESTVSSLQEEVLSLRSTLSSVNQSSSTPTSPSDTSASSQISTPGGSNSPPFSSVQRTHVSRSVTIPRKYNVLFFGIAEQATGLSRSVRIQSDYRHVNDLLCGMQEDSGHVCQVRDNVRVGKFNPSSDRPRPILVTLGSTADVSFILSKKHLLSSPVSVHRDLSPSQRLEHSILSQERKKLVDSNVDATLIRTRNSGLYVRDRLVGKVVDGIFVPSQNLGALAPPPANEVSHSSVIPSPTSHSSQSDVSPLTSNGSHGSSNSSSSSHSNITSPSSSDLPNMATSQ
uniref:PHD-type domain-containing protein n=1 Tax=Amphimedon queenslandica TaxID=400682 RepID=A0A1X7TUC5_AMPQE